MGKAYIIHTEDGFGEVVTDELLELRKKFVEQFNPNPDIECTWYSIDHPKQDKEETIYNEQKIKYRKL